ncbi:hypothetical protein GCM10027614_70740 [Micromonospora vulcania]
MSGATINGQTFTLQDLFDRATYDIDYYQREYAWTHEDIRTLVNDLCAQFEEAKADPGQGAAYIAPTPTSWARSSITNSAAGFGFLSTVSSASPHCT